MRLLKDVFASIGVLILLGFGLATFQSSKLGHVQVSDQAMWDVRSHAVDQVSDSVVFPAWARGRFGAFICGQEEPVYFHGMASILLEQSYALEAQLRCDTDSVHIGGRGPGQHFLGVSARDTDHLGIAAANNVVGPLSLHRTTQVIAPVKAEPIPDGDVYPPRSFIRAEDRELARNFTTTSAELIAITNLYHYWMPYSFEVQLNGTRQDPLLENGLTSYFACRGCPGDGLQAWRVTITAPNPDLVEIVTFVPGQ